MIRAITVLGIIATLGAVVAKTEAAPQNSQPTDKKSIAVHTPSSSEPAGIDAYPFHRPVTSGAIILYQKLISPARGTSCPMHPHCSEYGREAFANHSPIRAYIMTADRLLRCGHDLNQYRPTSVDGRRRYFDPIDLDQAFGGRMIALAAAGESESADDTNINPRSSANSTTSTNGDSDSLLFRFARQLQQEGDNQRAVTEYLRLVSYYPDSPFGGRAKLAAVQCYHAAGLFSQAVVYGESVLSEQPEATIADPIRFRVAASKFKSGDLDLALADFTGLSRGEGSFRQQSIMAQGLTHAHLHDWTAAAISFDAIDDSSQHSMKARYCARLAREASDLDYKNPKLAGLLAVVPGLGYLYDGYYGTALSALMVNGLFMWSTYEAFRQDHNGLGVTLTIFGMGWYAGNIYGSAYSAVRQNERRRHDHLLKFDLGFKF
ncbi:MAG: membrane protein insertion efficiency factor YidD [candidate division Zixibacteria bacterium]|nr:membrane protein insertion efficiency factor YidD [candidate division Zixibacteria bacterium]MDH3937573.1 membrane protein insertion efficiency factor YidD [candidate division Zixibacteria bacterium]MDH4032260.1 membrane protein insertion efficiency factor YidD [candidate division Zixibacteria bacterium]